MYDVHVREINAPAPAVGRLLDSLGGPDDELWPAPPWPPLRLAGPLSSHPSGGHGPVRYAVTGYEPGRSVEFTLDGRDGLRGTHTCTVEPLARDRCRITHVIEGELHGAARLAWPLAVRWLHDALVEDLFDRVDHDATPARWNRWVRILTALLASPAAPVGVPTTDLLADALPRVDHADALAVPARGTPVDPQAWADAIFRDPPRWVMGLMGLRQRLVGLVGIERSEASAFVTRYRTADEVLLGEDARHLDFRVSVLRRRHDVVLTTAVQIHSWRGRLYWAVVRHVHPIVARSMLARAARAQGRSVAVPM